jgi:hypothetical protein
MVNGERLIFFCAEMDVDPSPPSSPREQADSDPYKRAEKLIQDILKARTASQFQQVIEDAAPVDLDATPQLVRSAEPPSSLAQLIIRPGESGGLLSPTEFRFAKFCTEHKLKKRTSNCLLGMLKERAFILEDLHADSIREIEKLISDSCKGKIREYDLWTEMDGLQEVKLYLRSLRQIIEDLLRHHGYRNLQYLHFEYRECNGERIFGPANGGIWWQITVRDLQITVANQSCKSQSQGSGSPLFMLNVHLWQFGRPQARTISVQQRHANKERAQKAAIQKRAQRMPYTREKAARHAGPPARAMRTAAQ